MKQTTTFIKVGLKSNANFLFGQMRGDTLGGVDGKPYWVSVLYLTDNQFAKFKQLIFAFGGDIEKSLTKVQEHSFLDAVDYDCFFIRR